VAQKSGLNRSILDQGWGEFCRQLEYKQEWRGGMVLFVDRHTSQICPICGHLAKDNRLTQETFRCLECFFDSNANSVASQNILSPGLGFLN
jgi:putative transposase